jgi:hypothetical protein
MNVFGPAAILCLGACRYAHYLSLLRMRNGAHVAKWPIFPAGPPGRAVIGTTELASAGIRRAPVSGPIGMSDAELMSLKSRVI